MVETLLICHVFLQEMTNQLQQYNQCHHNHLFLEQSQYLPYKNISLNSDINIDNIENILDTPDNNDIGYIIECDLEYPAEIHDKLKEFPPCPENLAPTKEMLSEYQKQIAEQNKVKIGGCAKLVPHLMKHEKYCIHYRNLKFVKELGVNITKIHNVVQFNQKPFLK